jgi:hypothetical protein
MAKKASETKSTTLDDTVVLHKMHRALNRALLARLESGEPQPQNSRSPQPCCEPMA